MEIIYQNEALLWGKIGNLFVVGAFIAALLSGVFYFYASKNNDQGFLKYARNAFKLHAFSVLGIIAIMFYLILNHKFEFHYVWQHSNKMLPLRYMLSCFWEGQEGSFLLWTFWNMVLGLILMYTAKSWEKQVMFVFALVQMFLVSMLLGLKFGDIAIGSNPFLLLRLHPDMANLPFLMNPDYLKSLDGRGLNPLLQNYWMTIHPPTLFLGFASTLVPFAFAIAGLWTKKYNEWMKPALPWAFFSVMILGTGILMGGAWAYEALSFGGFWAWDPVENSSLVPWLIMTGAAHVMLIHKNKGSSLITTFALTLLAFLLVLYSTFLTRSGILGDTSVHAFTDLGMSGQLLIYLLAFVFLSFGLLIYRFKDLPKSTQEEHFLSREFWMFIGALVLLLSAFQVSLTTSIPVFNKVFGTNIAPPINIIQHYNSFQIPLAIVVALLTATGQFFRYKKTDWNEFIKSMSLSFFASIVLAFASAIALKMYNFSYYLLLFASFFSVLANADYLVRKIKLKWRFAGASIAHIGFAFILAGALISTSTGKTISQNTSGVDISNLGKDFNNQDNIMLSLNDTLGMGDYYVTYAGKKKEGVNIYYRVDFLKYNTNGTFEKDFSLYPLVQTNPRMGNVAEPDTRHFLHKDIYTHVTYAELTTEEDEEEKNNEWRPENTTMAHIGDTLFSSNAMIKLMGVTQDFDKTKLGFDSSAVAVKAILEVKTMKGDQYFAEPAFGITQNMIVPAESEVKPLGLKFRFDKIDTETGQLQISIAEKKTNSKEFIILKAIEFPYINVLWIGCLLLVVGSSIAVTNRVKLNLARN